MYVLGENTELGIVQFGYDHFLTTKNISMTCCIIIISEYILNSHEAIPIPVSTRRTYVDPTTYASPDEAVEEFAKEIEPKTLRLDAEIGAGMYVYIRECALPVYGQVNILYKRVTKNTKDAYTGKTLRE